MYRQGETAIQECCGPCTGISSPAEEMPTGSSRHDYQRVQFCCFFMLVNFPKPYECLISIACAQNVTLGYGLLLSIKGRCVI